MPASRRTSVIDPATQFIKHAYELGSVEGIDLPNEVIERAIDDVADVLVGLRELSQVRTEARRPQQKPSSSIAAEVDFDREATKSSVEAESWYSDGYVRLAQGESEAALQSFDHALELNPNYADALARRGETYRLLGRYEEALTDLNRALELNPDDTWALGTRGETYEQMGRYEEALTDLNRALELNPDYEWALLKRAGIYKVTGHYDEALTDYSRLLEYSPNDPELHDDVADINFALGHFEEAKRLYRERIRMRSDDALNSLVHLGLISLHEGDNPSATESFRKALDVWDGAYVGTFQEAYVLENKSLALMVLQRTSEAIVTLVQAVNSMKPGYRVIPRTYELLQSVSPPLSGLEAILEIIRERIAPYDQGA